MPFHTPTFLLLCLLTLGLYHRGGERWQHAVLTTASLVFYYYAGPVDTALLVFVVAANHFAAKVVARRDRTGSRALVCAVAFDIAVLVYFKYRAMGVLWFNWAADGHLSVPSVVIPLGISFYVFQLVAYQVDVHRGVLPPEKSFWRTFLYIAFFPHHQAGPIMRPAKFLPQFYGAKPVDWDALRRGGTWILWGLAKKVAADNVARSVDAGFAGSGPETAAGAWVLAVTYAAQIYGDFSGYSDIAVGLGHLFGYQLDRNFHQPYLASTPAEFWRKWHVTLSQWLRDYLYIPLGGNRTGPGRTYVNLMLTMLIGGLWHGASIMFLFWGFVHGALLVVHRRFPAAFSVAPLGWAITFGFTVTAWVPFRATTWEQATRFLRTMYGGGAVGSLREWAGVAIVAAVLLLLHRLEDVVLGTPERRLRWGRVWTRVPQFWRGSVYGAVIVVTLAALVDHTAYIYFRF